MGDDLLYDSLPDRSIRVLTVYSARRPDAPLRGSISHVYLDAPDHPKFSALSYVWGHSGDEPLSILCGGILLPILPNLFSALRNLRNKLGAFTIWADAICINQEDDGEKQHQILLMAEIYAKAEYVYVWLGIGSMKTQRAMEYLQKPPFMGYFIPAGFIENIVPQPRLYSALSVYLLQGLKNNNPLFPRDFAPHPNSPLIHPAEVTFEDIANLLDTQWLERMWTYQEILLASNPILVCGHDHLDWPTFVATIAFLEYSGYFYRGDRRGYLPASAWFKLALTRDYLCYTSRDAWREYPETAETTSRSTPLRSYIEFLEAIARLDERLITKTMFLPIYILAGLLLSIEIASHATGSFVRRCKPEAVQRNFGYVSTAGHTSPSLCEPMPRGMLICIIVLTAIGIITFVVNRVRISRNAIMQPVNHTPGVRVDLVDALLYRKSKLNHDKAFALRNILQRLSHMEMPLPDYNQPLDLTFSDLNWHLYHAIGYNGLLPLASIMPLANHPSWMVDWSCKPDSFWLSGSRSWNASVQAPGAVLLAPRLIEDTVALNRHVECEIKIICRLDHLFGFTPINDPEDMLGLKSNLETGLALATYSAEIVEQKRFRKDNLQNLLGISAPTIYWPSIVEWVDFIYIHYNEDPGQALNILTTKPKLIETQIALCNSLAQNGRKLFLYKSQKLERPVSHYQYTFGICRDTVKERDFLIKVPGVEIPLIVSALSGGEDGVLGQVRLVSPAIVKGGVMPSGEKRNIIFV